MQNTPMIALAILFEMSLPAVHLTSYLLAASEERIIILAQRGAFLFKVVSVRRGPISSKTVKVWKI